MAKRNKLVAGLVLGAAVGAAAGLLLAPAPGKESRVVVASRLEKLRQKAGVGMRTLRRMKTHQLDAADMEDTSDERIIISS